MASPGPPERHRVGPFELQPDKRRLLKDGATISLRPRAFDLLVALVDRVGHLVTKVERCPWTMPSVTHWTRRPDAIPERVAGTGWSMRLWVESKSLRKLAVSVPLCLKDAAGYELSNQAQ
jgi:hypothetical protein